MIYFIANEEVLSDETASVEHVATEQKRLSRRVQQCSKASVIKKKKKKNTLKKSVLFKQNCNCYNWWLTDLQQRLHTGYNGLYGYR